MFVTDHRAALQYDGTNSAAILALVQNPAQQWAIESETGGVLTLRFDLGFLVFPEVNTGQWVVANNTPGDIYAVCSDAEFAARFIPVPES